VQHNDIIQTYTKGGSDAGSPTNWIVRYNWIEMQQTSGSGDNSWLMLESMSGDPALKVYGNVFVGSGTDGNNGLACTRNHGGAYYCYNNTFVRHHNPDNTVRFMDSGTLYAKNNVGIEDAGISGTFLDWTMTTGAWDYNFWYGFAASSQYFGAHGSTSILPVFTNYLGNIFSLLPSSPLRGKGDRTIGAEYNQGIAAGSTWPNPTLVPRSSWDIGAYESGSTPSAPRNLHVVPAR
jgi:hypothetical protein